MRGYNNPMKACVFILALIVFAACAARAPEHRPAPVSGDSVVIDLSALPDDLPVFYTYEFAGGQVNFFVVKTSGKAMAFLDACKKCYPKKKGFEYLNDAVKCNACNESYPVEKIEHGVGSCVPIKLDAGVAGGKLSIKLEALKSSAGMF